MLQVLEVTEQLLRSSDLLADFSNKQLPASSDAGMFLANLGQVLAAQPQLGSVVRCGAARGGLQAGWVWSVPQAATFYPTASHAE